jgi:heat shock protein HspQ
MEAKDAKGLLEAYASVYKNISESHFKVGDEVKSKSNGMEGKVVKVDPEGKGKYYTVKHKDGKTMKHSPVDLKLDKEEEEGASKEKETEFHDKLDKMVHKTFGKRKEEESMKEHKEETELFDYLLEYLVAEGYADTNKAALVIMANMSEEWRQSIVEQSAIGARAAKVVDDQRQGYHGDSDAINKLQDAASRSMGRLKRGQGPVVTPGLPRV